jgi:uncharacterized membrane protein
MDTLIAKFHLHPIIDHFTIALLSIGVLGDMLAGVMAPLCARNDLLRIWRERLKGAAVQLLVVGALAAMLSRFTGEREAERLWDTMSPAAQNLLLSDTGSARFLSHAVLGTYLMYVFPALAIWRVLYELSPYIRRTRPVYLAIAIFATGALLFQGKTGGELVFDYGVGIPSATSSARHTVDAPRGHLSYGEKAVIQTDP